MSNNNNSEFYPEEIDVLATAQKLRQQTQLPNSTASTHEIHGEITGATATKQD